MSVCKHNGIRWCRYWQQESKAGRNGCRQHQIKWVHSNRYTLKIFRIKEFGKAVYTYCLWVMTVKYRSGTSKGHIVNQWYKNEIFRENTMNSSWTCSCFFLWQIMISWYPKSISLILTALSFATHSIRINRILLLALGQGNQVWKQDVQRAFRQFPV